jgi:2-oxoisovalerate dehydrogenase E1 component
MQFDTKSLSLKKQIALYKRLLLPRLIEEKMLILLRQGKISKWFSGIGQEAISVGITAALEEDDFILPLHRNLGVFTGRDIPLSKLFAQWQGKKEGFTKGRDRSFHFGSTEHHIVGMISHLGSNHGVANGIALGELLSNSNAITIVFSGDGGTSEGDFHEAMNVAAVWDLPVLFVIENNGYGLSTPGAEQFRCKQFIDKGIGYGMEAHQIDGNNILDVFHKTQELAKTMRKKPRPILLECLTFRMRGHEEASGTKYVPQELFTKWEKKDPINNYKKHLLSIGVKENNLIAIEEEHKETINQSLKEVFEIPEIEANIDDEYADLHAPHTFIPVVAESPKENLRLIDAIKLGLEQSMEKFPNTVLMGQDVAEYGGVFKITDGFLEKFGKERIRNTPITESSILGAGLGLAIKGYKAIVEMQFADFVSCGFNQIANNLAKVHYRWGQAADVLVRMPCGAGVQAGPFHSQTMEAWFAHVPGLKIIYPAFPYDAKGLLASAIEEPNPILFFEHKKLYRSIEQEVPTDYYNLPIGKASVVSEGNDATIVTYGWAVHWALDLKEKNNLDIEIIDLRTLIPWDQKTVRESVAKTNKVMVLHEASLTAGIGAEIAAWIGEHLFKDLDAPVVRVGSLDTPIPFAKSLEDYYLPFDEFERKLTELLAF